MKKSIVYFSTMISLCLLFTGCAHATDSKSAKKENTEKKSAEISLKDLQKKYGTDAYYFMGLVAEKNGEEKNAAKYFQKALSSKSKTVGALAAKKIVNLESSKNAINYASDFYKTYNDDQSLAVYLGALHKSEEWEKIISLTKNLDFSSTSDEILFYLCNALLEKKDPAFPGIFNLWCSVKPFSSYHDTIFKYIKNYPNNDFAFATEIAQMREAAYKRDWGQAAGYAKNILSDKKNLKPQLVCDCGKALLYGSTNYESNGALFESFASENQQLDYYFNFYAARIYSQMENGSEKSMECFKRAMDESCDDNQYDNALWYYLCEAQKISTEKAIEETEIYCTKWNDANYFDDFFESLSVQILTEKKWDLYAKLTKIIDQYASAETVSKYSYTTASLIENDFYVPEEIKDGKKIVQSKKDDLIYTLYFRALDGGTDTYHKLMAAAKLNLSDEETWKHFDLWHEDKSFESNQEIETIFYGYMDFDLVDFVYPFWLEHSSEISLDCAKKVSAYLYEKTEEDSSFYYPALRVAAKKLNNSETTVDEEIMKLSFPCGFSDLVEKYTAEYKLNDYLLYSLIRMESFFSPGVKSHAGAVGLCQLMDFTAEEVATKLKKESYDLTSPETSIEFGSFYLNELISRLDNTLMAICSYNAGAGNVRSRFRNLSSTLKRNDLPKDLFLEMLNITETRKYGRNVSATAAVYAYLYQGISPTAVIKEIVGFN